MGKIMKGIVVLCLIHLLSGCATTNSIKVNYEKINYSDGINKEEAVLIAKNHLLSTKYKYDYQIISPLVLNNKSTRQYPDFWCIRFHPKKLHLMPYYYLVMINKKTGEIVSYGETAISGEERS